MFGHFILKPRKIFQCSNVINHNVLQMPMSGTEKKKLKFVKKKKDTEHTIIYDSESLGKGKH